VTRFGGLRSHNDLIAYDIDLKMTQFLTLTNDPPPPGKSHKCLFALKPFCTGDAAPVLSKSYV